MSKAKSKPHKGQRGKGPVPVPFAPAAGRLSPRTTATAGAGRQISPFDELKTRGTLAAGQGRLGEAVEAFEAAIRLQPGHSEAHGFLGLLYHKQGRLRDAFALCHKAVTINPEDHVSYTYLSGVLSEIGQVEAAKAASRLAITLAPDFAPAYFGLAQGLRAEGKKEEAADVYRQLLAREPDFGEALVELCHLRQHFCDWDGLPEQQAASLLHSYRKGRRVAPFPIMASTPSALEQQLCARVWAKKVKQAGGQTLTTYAARPAGERARRIRVGYLSADFYSHATAFLVAELLELRDRSVFEIFGYSIGPDDGSDIRRRIVASFDAFADLRGTSHAEAAARIHADGLDVLVDLKGYTQDARPEILAYRPAPIQVNFLGYPATMGADFVDYIIGDAFILPRGSERFYDEKIVHLPHCYQPNDRLREIAAHRPTRADCGLPADGFVFCSFNNSYKITPAFFDIWMRLLRGTPGSVLWLLETNRNVSGNLAREAAARGVDPARIVFAPKIGPENHLARMGLGDLFLDTLPVNAHTTASEALWVGLPVLTCAGEAFAARVAGSLLHAIGLPELVTTTLHDYEATALALACDTTRLAGIRETLKNNRLTAPLFDTARYARNFDVALLRMVERMDDGEAPGPFAVTDQTGPLYRTAVVSPVPAGLKAFSGPWAHHRDRHCLWIVTPPGYTHHQAFDDVALGLAEAFTALGGSAPVVRRSQDWNGRVPIVFGPHLLPPEAAMSLPPGSVLYNFEQVDPRSGWLRPDYLALLQRFPVLDYSARNRDALARLGIGHARLLSVGHSPGLSRVLPSATQDIDVLFYGSVNERRARVLDALRSRGLAVHHLFDVYGAERDAAIARSKVVLNLHYYEAAVFETVRVSLLLANRTCVVTEGEAGDPDIAPFADGLVVCLYDQLVERCVDLVPDEAARRAIAARGVAAATRHRQADLLKQMFNEAATCSPGAREAETAGRSGL